MAALALAVDEGRDDAAELAARRLAVLLHVLLALLADGRGAALAEIGKLLRPLNKVLLLANIVKHLPHDR